MPEVAIYYAGTQPAVGILENSDDTQRCKMKYEWFFKTVRGIQWFTLYTAPWATCLFALRGDYREALLSVTPWMMVVTNMLVVKKPKGIEG